MVFEILLLSVSMPSVGLYLTWLPVRERLNIDPRGHDQLKIVPQLGLHDPTEPFTPSSPMQAYQSSHQHAVTQLLLIDPIAPHDSSLENPTTHCEKWIDRPANLEFPLDCCFEVPPECMRRCFDRTIPLHDKGKRTTNVLIQPTEGHEGVKLTDCTRGAPLNTQYGALCFPLHTPLYKHHANSTAIWYYPFLSTEQKDQSQALVLLISDPETAIFSSGLKERTANQFMIEGVWTTNPPLRVQPRMSHLDGSLLLLVAAELNKKRAIALILMMQVRYAAAAGGEDQTGGPKCPIFEGINVAFVSWLIAFSAWIAWKKPELAPFIRGTSAAPTPANPNAPTPRERTAIRKWNELNIQLYGAVVSHVSPPIQASLHVATPDDGVAAVNLLRQRYGARSAGDRAEAMARVQRSYIDPRAKISEADVIKQYNEMSMAVADIQASGGAAIDDSLLISMFENALPVAYGSIRQMIRYKQHTAFAAYYNDLLTQVKAEERSAQPTIASAFATTYTDAGKGRSFGKGKGGKGRYGYSEGRGRGKGSGRSWQQGYSACFNCGRKDHPRYNCPEPPATCDYCGANHVSELCPLGPGGPLRDSLSANARVAIDRAAGKAHRPRPALLTMAGEDSTTGSTSQSYTDPQFRQSLAYSASGKRPYSSVSRNDVMPHDSASNVGSSFSDSAVGHGTPTGKRPSPQGGARAYRAGGYAAQNHVPSTYEIDEFIRAGDYHAFMVNSTSGQSTDLTSDSIHALAYIDSQATHFVVPYVEYLSKVIDWSPTVTVETANGLVKPLAIGELSISLVDDNERWHSFDVPNVWVLPTCKKVLYSQGAMRDLGIQHYLDQGYIQFSDGSRKCISIQTHAVELMIGRPTTCASISPSSSALAARSSKSTVPQKLLWQRLGCPSQRVWSGVCDVVSDHALPPNPHLRHDFEMSDAIARARARLLPFQRLRDPDPSFAAGATIYMDFAGPMVPSFPHQFIYYCGAIDAGSGYARLTPCHSATKEVAKACLELLMADLRMLLDLPHRFRPQVVVTDQGTQFMSSYFSDFLSDEQIVHRPAVTYTPQQNAYVERMWGTRFGVARTLLKAANLGPSFHPFAVQTANWICNRMPQPWKGNMSPFFILARRAASIAYLRVFGSLARMTIPWARREGDKHFADRGVLGIYLGPSEVSPGCVVYVPSTRRFYTSRDVICYEDTLPGVKNIDSKWRDLEALESGQELLPISHNPHSSRSGTLELSEPQPSSGGTTATDGTRDLQVDISESPTIDIPPPDGDNVNPDEQLDGEQNLGQIHPLVDSVTDQLETSRNVRQKLPAADSGDPDDPSSRAFVRRLPARGTRYHGSYYTDPTSATVSEHIRNAIQQAMYTHGVPILGNVVLYESSTSCPDRALAVASTLEMGDILIPRSYQQALHAPESSYWRDAISKELKGLVEIGTFEFIRACELPEHANVMRCHFVFTVKRNADGSIEKFKARLVADGNTQRWGVDFDKVFSTVAKLSTLRLILIIAAANDYNLTSADVRQAYLQATLQEELYMMVPPGMPEYDEDGYALVTRLRRSLYGLKQAGREWHKLFSTTLQRWGFTQSCIDTCLFTYRRGESFIWLVIWVDDCIIVDNDSSLRNEFVQFLNENHPTEDKGELTWVLQVKVVRDRANRSLTLSQQMYVCDLIKRHGQLISGLTRRFDSPFDAALDLSPDQCPADGSQEQIDMQPNRETYMSLVGAYLWLSNVSRPDLCFISSQLARYVSNPGFVHYRAALRVLIYLQGSSDRGLVFKPNVSLPLRAFVDADWSTKFSVSGGLIDYMGAPVHWLSRSQRSVSMSSTESEFFAASLVVKEVIFFRELLHDLGLTPDGPTAVRSDNRGVVDLSFDPIAFKKTKHILRAAEFVRDLCLRRLISMQWISGSNNPADVLTKAVSCALFRKLCSLLSNLPGIT